MTTHCTQSSPALYRLTQTTHREFSPHSFEEISQSPYLFSFFVLSLVCTPVLFCIVLSCSFYFYGSFFSSVSQDSRSFLFVFLDFKVWRSSFWKWTHIFEQKTVTSMLRIGYTLLAAGTGCRSSISFQVSAILFFSVKRSVISDATNSICWNLSGLTGNISALAKPDVMLGSVKTFRIA